MIITGIVSEYNPFHNGHKYHLEQAKQGTNADAIVAVMSGNYMQRGEIAVADKWNRARWAVLGGVDLVIELPMAFSVQSAEFFASYGVSALEGMGCVDNLAFGSECGDLEKLITLGSFLAEPTEKFNEELKGVLAEGERYPVARAQAIGKVLGQEYKEILRSPNNTLGVEYIKALIKGKSKIKPYTVKRYMADHHALEAKGNIASATLVRKTVSSGNLEEISCLVTEDTYLGLKQLEQKGFLTDYRKFDEFMFHQLLTKREEDFLKTADIREGLESRIVKAVCQSRNMDEVRRQIQTKRYTETALNRILLHTVFGIPKQFRKEKMPYIKVLAFNDRGREVLAAAAETAKIPIIIKPKEAERLGGFAKQIFELERMGQDVFACCTEKQQGKGLEYKTSPVYITSAQ